MVYCQPHIRGEGRNGGLKFLQGTDTIISALISLAKASHAAIPEFHREAIIHSYTEKEGRYQQSLLQPPNKVVSALSSLKYEMSPPLWSLSQKHSPPALLQNKLKTVSPPSPIQHSSP